MADDFPSMHQEAWVKLAGQWRVRLAAAMPEAKSLSPAQAKEYGEALDAAYTLELNARRMDAWVAQTERGFE